MHIIKKQNVFVIIEINNQLINYKVHNVENFKSFFKKEVWSELLLRH